MIRKDAVKQILGLTLLSALSVAPLLWRRGTDIVTRTYQEAALRFESGANPYSEPSDTSTDQYKYGPAFAVLYRPLAHLSDKNHATIWALLNVFVFWAGVGAFFAVRKNMGWLKWVALAAVAMELDISVRYQQVNALLAGLALLGIAAYRDGRMARAASFLTAATWMKVLPVVFLGAFSWPWRRRYFVGALCTALVLFLVPALFRGPWGAWWLHLDWLMTLAADMGAAGLLDLRTVLLKVGAWPSEAETARGTVVLFTVLFFGGYRWLKHESFDYGIFWALGASALLLLSPRTESPTFVLFAPAYLFFAEDLVKRNAKWMERGAFVLLLFFLTFAYTDLWPKFLWNPAKGGYLSKTFAALGFWIWSLVRVWKDSSMTSRLFPKKSAA